jgi:hypothetical protein
VAGTLRLLPLGEPEVVVTCRGGDLCETATGIGGRPRAAHHGGGEGDGDGGALRVMGSQGSDDDDDDAGSAGAASSEEGTDERPRMDKGAEDRASFLAAEVAHHTAPWGDENWKYHRCHLRCSCLVSSDEDSTTHLALVLVAADCQ